MDDLATLSATPNVFMSKCLGLASILSSTVMVNWLVQRLNSNCEKKK